MNLRKQIVKVLRIPALMRGLHEGGVNWSLCDESVRDRMQLDALNEVWQDAVENIPFYAWWKEQHNLPDKIASFEEYAKWPVLKKSELQSHQEMLIRCTNRKSHASVTGGATGEPLHFRNFPEQATRVNASLLMARAGLGMFPGDRIFLFWGHRHFYGIGLAAKKRFFIRRCKDWLNNTYRADACDLTPQYLTWLGKKISRFNPEAIIAYSGSLLAFVRFAKERDIVFKGGRLRCIICTAGPLLKNEREEVSAYFGAPVYMEYGAMDTGQMAYMQKDGRYHVFQHYRMIQTVNDGVADVNVLTSLTKDYLPFFRYYVGDYLTDCKYTLDGRVLSFSEVWGRGSDVITLPSGSKLQALSLMVCVEKCPKALAYQVVRKGSIFEMHLQVSSPLSDDERTHFFDCAYAITPELKQLNMAIVEKDELVKAPSGKIRLLIEYSI